MSENQVFQQEENSGNNKSRDINTRKRIYQALDPVESLNGITIEAREEHTVFFIFDRFNHHNITFKFIWNFKRRRFDVYSGNIRWSSLTYLLSINNLLDVCGFVTMLQFIYKHQFSDAHLS